MKEKNVSELSLRLEAVIRHFKLNNSKLAEIAEVTPTAIGDIMNGTTDNPKISLLKNISSKLNVSIDWLANGDGEMLKDNSLKSTTNDKKEVDFNLMKYMRKVEFLQSVLLQNGIKVEMPNFNPGVSVSVLGNTNNHIFFDK